MHLYNYDLFNPVDDHVREVTMVNYLWVGTNCYSCLFYQLIVRCYGIIGGIAYCLDRITVQLYAYGVNDLDIIS